MEPYVSNKANPLTDELCREGMRRAARSLRGPYEQGGDAGAREDMALVSLFGGLALVNAKLGAVQGFAGPLGGMFPAPHGAVCASLLPHVVAVNVRALQARAPQSERLHRHDEMARILTGDGHATAAGGVAWVQGLCQALRIPSLASYGVMEGSFPLLIEKGSRSSSMKGNPILLTGDEMREILTRALQVLTVVATIKATACGWLRFRAIMSVSRTVLLYQLRGCSVSASDSEYVLPPS